MKTIVMASWSDARVEDVHVGARTTVRSAVAMIIIFGHARSKVAQVLSQNRSHRDVVTDSTAREDQDRISGTPPS